MNIFLIIGFLIYGFYGIRQSSERQSSVIAIPMWSETGPDFCPMICQIQQRGKIDTNNVLIYVHIVFKV